MSQTWAPSISSHTRTQRAAQDAAVVVEHEARMRHVDRQARRIVGIADVGDAEALRQSLQLAMAVGDADRAEVVALDEQQLQRQAPVTVQAVRGRW